MQDSGVIIDDDGNVGVGTIPTTAKLDIKGKSKFRGPSDGESSINENLSAIIVGPNAQRDATANSYYPGVGFNHLLSYNGNWENQLHAWIGTRLISTNGSELSGLVFATTTDTGNPHEKFPIEKMVILPNGNVGVNIFSRKTKLDINGNIGLKNTYKIETFDWQVSSGTIICPLACTEGGLLKVTVTTWKAEFFEGRVVYRNSGSSCSQNIEIATMTKIAGAGDLNVTAEPDGTNIKLNYTNAHSNAHGWSFVVEYI